jgi:hypothetical protein
LAFRLASKQWWAVFVVVISNTVTQYMQVSSHSPSVSSPALELLATASAHPECRRKIIESGIKILTNRTRQSFYVSFCAGMMSAVVIALQSEVPELVVNAAKVMSNLARDKDMQVHPAPQTVQ